MNAVFPKSYWEVQTDDTPLYFLHIAKTAGTSLISMLDDHFRPSEICPAQLFPEFFQIPKERLREYRFFRGHLWFGLHEYIDRSVKYITLLRHPVDRIISYYHHVCDDSESYRHSRAVSEKWTLSDFVNDSETNWDIINTQTLFLSANYDFEELAKDPVVYGRARVKEILRNTSEDHLLRIATQRLAEFAFVGITERMTDSVNLLCYTFGWNPNVEVGRLRVTPSKLRQADIPKATLEKIYELNRADMALYEYAQELFAKRFSRMVKELNSFHFASVNRGSRFIVHKFDEPFSGSGWYDLEDESGTGKSWRWSGPSAISTISFLLENENRDLFLELCLIKWMSDEILDSLKVSVNDHLMEMRKEFHLNREITFECLISARLLASAKGFAHLSFQVNRTITPRSLDPSVTDDRLLGIAVNRIIITPENMLILESQRAENCLLPDHWHEPETYRWSSQPLSSVRFIRAHEERVVCLETYSGFPGEYHVEVLLNGQCIGSMDFKEPSYRTFGFPIDHISSGAFILSFKVPFMWKPFVYLGTADMRDLGIAIKSMTLCQ